jgi:hypothetical protein
VRRSLALAVLLAAGLAPSAASACTIDNCVEVRRAAASWAGDDLHTLGGSCVVAGRGGARFAVAGEASGRDALLPAAAVTVRCTAYAGGVLVYDDAATRTGPVTALAGTFVSRHDIRVCVTVVGEYLDGHSIDVEDCS